ncbi:putative porin [Herminiimonas arsenicoxydans]|uniref:Porin n=1 Tax=Herminiimonas arsenicoxydans TaxID=204773 RepID=A4G1S8_HERAR|nr:putative porin [Herminiimonas arsenicoxydans]
MKKSLLALAVLGAFAGAASAQSSVTVYGIVDMGITSQDTGAGANDRLNGVTSGNQSASRIGFKGTEDLGNGLKANFVLEQTIAADTGVLSQVDGKTAFNRFATVGLSGNFGAVNLGRQVSAIKDAYDAIDPFGDGGTIAPISAIFFNAALKGDNGRISNSIKYTSNSYSGFKFGAHYAFGEQAGRTGADSNYGLNLGYANGPLNVQFGYMSGDDSTAGAPGFKPVKNSKDKMTFLGATYDFGVAKLHAAYGDSKNQPVAGNVDNKYRNYMLGVSAKVGAAGSIMASYTVNDTRTFGGVKANDRDSKRAGIMYAHDLSKRTNLYAGYSHTSNDKNAKLNALVADQSGSMFAVGVRHKF